MRKYVRFIYGICIILVFIMLLLFHFHEKTVSVVAREEGNYEILDDYEFTTFDDETAPLGITQEYKWILQNISQHDACVTFYLIHQEVDVYIEDHLVYSFGRESNHNFSKTTGCSWPEIFLSEKDEGKEIRILIHPVYKSSISNKLKIYYGDHSVITNNIIIRSLPILVISLFSIILGLAIVLFVLYNIKNLEVDRSIFMLGVFSIVIGVWKISDMEAATLLFRAPITLSALSIISITLTLVPFMYFIRKQFQHTNSAPWDFVCMIVNVLTIGIVLLQLFGIADLRETLWVSHTTMVSVIAFILLMLVKEFRVGKISPKLKLTFFCCMLCAFGAVLDMSIYYISGNTGNMIFGILAFQIYVIIMGYSTLKETKQLMDRGKEATHYQKLAMHDELTGLFNRAHYSDFISNNDVLQNDCFLIMMDVNNLKLCNDTRGHEAGDHLLINSANLIRQAFPNGVCHRIGGDEFCVFLCNSSEEDCKTCLHVFDKLTEEFNAMHPEEFPVHIAYGYADHIAKVDFDFSDTLRRADRMMYQTKLAMKTRATS